MAQRIAGKYGLVVVGGGISGMCAAIAAARHGVHVALVQNRPVLGGNNSSEIRMHICGASLGIRRPDARETGIIEELQEINRARNPHHCWSIYDTVLWEMAHFQEGLDLYLNTHCRDVRMNGEAIAGVVADQMTTEKCFELSAELFVDATGDGTLGALAGAEYMSGREGREVFGESFAPPQSDNYTMGNTLMFKAVDIGKPVEFRPPFWANKYTEQDLRFRDHKNINGGYWWIELGGDGLDVIADGEEIRDELLRAVYGVWDHIKNGGDHGAETWDLDWVQFLPGKRESRRLLGDYVLTQKDIMENTQFPDAIAYGGWSIDLHALGGLRNSDEEGATMHLEKYTPKELFQIPYRCVYSKNVPNLFLAGRAISVSHVAFGATRQIAQCAIVGQTVGTAASLALERKLTLRGVLDCVSELQQLLLRDDCFIPGVRNEDPGDLARNAQVSCSSHAEGGEPAQVVNGWARRTKDAENAWISDEPAENQWLRLKLRQPARVGEVRLTFDPNLTMEIKISISKGAQDRQIPGIPKELVRDYDLELFLGDEAVSRLEVRDNFLRHRAHVLDEGVLCDAIRLTVLATRGDTRARVFEVRVYGPGDKER